MIKYFATKRAAVAYIKSLGYQRDQPRKDDVWFKYAPWGRGQSHAIVGRASKATHKGLWAVSKEG